MMTVATFAARFNHALTAMRKVYHLSSCSTCQQIIRQLGLAEKGFEMQDIKQDSKQDSKEPSLRVRALRHLARREYTRQELSRLLAPHAESEDEVTQILDDFASRRRSSASSSQGIDMARIRQVLASMDAAMYSHSEVLANLTRKINDENILPQELWDARGPVGRSWEKLLPPVPRQSKQRRAPPIVPPPIIPLCCLRYRRAHVYNIVCVLLLLCYAHIPSSR
jgi:SOS response regulatory protein OraA/RecX